MTGWGATGDWKIPPAENELQNYLQNELQNELQDYEMNLDDVS